MSNFELLGIVILTLIVAGLAATFYLARDVRTEHKHHHHL